MIQRSWRAPLGAVFAATVLLGLALAPARGSVAQAAAPAGLPGHFGIGLAAHPDNTGLDGWLPNSGIPWDYAYQYLSGGVNTGAGWETWNSSGQFPLYYAQSAAPHGYIPVFPYYELLQSNGSCGSCGEAQKDLSNLNNAGLMASYYQNFALLMKRLGGGTYDGIAGFGQTAVVHVEPDLSGYAEQAVLNNGSCYGYCSGQGNNPANLSAAVAASGDADVAAFPNTYQGFNWALLHLRDLYAPNVLLAFHVSDWATATDIGTNTSANLDATGLGAEAGSFAAQSGIAGLPSGVHGYDLLFNDVSDRDAAYYKYVYGDPTHWWDRLNVTFPNFQRWEAYIHAASQAAGRPFIIWQIPEGNQYFDSENNSNGHYQDNRAEYFFGHIPELQAAGIIGLLFGAGNGGSTVQFDGMGDGVTNPPSFCTSDGLSSGQICDTHTSSVSDDDGGYIRMMAQAYYAGLAGGSPTATASPTATPTSAATATATPTAIATATSSPTATATGVPAATPTSTSTATPTLTEATSASPATVSHGKRVTLRVAVTAQNAPLHDGIVDLEIYNAAGQRVYQRFWSGQTINQGQTVTRTAYWTAPGVAGAYRVAVGVFTTNWATDLLWANQAATVTVQ